VREAASFFAIEGALALAVTFVINIFVIAVFSAGFYGKSTEDEIGLGNAGEYLRERFGVSVSCRS
jgi:Mn2+/Fe2+ NRAMP family transporter